MTPQDLAEWMVQELSQRRTLPQSRVATYARQHNPELVYKNRNRNWGLVKPVLDAFRKLTADDDNVVWSRSNQHWRQRKPTDKPGRMQR